MYTILVGIEKVLLKIKKVFILCFYKLKYGKRFKYGKKLNFRKRFQVNISKHGRVVIGDNCFFNNDCSINSHKEIIIGNDNLFGENVKIYDHNHIFNNKNIDYKKNFTDRQIIIGNHNWFGSNCTILSKAKIGSNNVFSANTCINQNIDSDNIVRLNQELIQEKIIYK